MSYHNLKKNTDVQILELEQEIMLHDMNKHKVYVLNTTASAIWTMCDGTRNLEQIIQSLEISFKTPTSVAQDVRSTMDELKSYGLLG